MEARYVASLGEALYGARRLRGGRRPASTAAAPPQTPCSLSCSRADCLADQIGKPKEEVTSWCAGCQRWRGLVACPSRCLRLALDRRRTHHRRCRWPTLSTLPPCPRPARTPYPGGAPANVATGVARLGTGSLFISAIGDDELGDRFVALLKGSFCRTFAVLAAPPTLLLRSSAGAPAARPPPAAAARPAAHRPAQSAAWTWAACSVWADPPGTSW